MNSFRFTKMHGLGNSYIYVNQFEEQLPEERLAEIAVKVSSIHTGIGSDGMILICPSEKAPVKMRIFNNDGSEGKNCGNGLRCVAKYAYEHKLTEETSFFIETLSGLVKADITEDNGIVREVAVDMGEPRLTKKELPMLGNEDERTIDETFVFGETELSGTAVSMGNPILFFRLRISIKRLLQRSAPSLKKTRDFRKASMSNLWKPSAPMNFISAYGNAAPALRRLAEQAPVRRLSHPY